MLLLLIVGTPCFACLALYLNLRVHLAPWYAPALSLSWTIQNLFTGLAAGYTFAALGARLFLPFGLIPLFLAAFRFADDCEGGRPLLDRASSEEPRESP